MLVIFEITICPYVFIANSAISEVRCFHVENTVKLSVTFTVRVSSCVTCDEFRKPGECRMTVRNPLRRTSLSRLITLFTNSIRELVISPRSRHAVPSHVQLSFPKPYLGICSARRLLAFPYTRRIIESVFFFLFTDCLKPSCFTDGAAVFVDSVLYH